MAFYFARIWLTDSAAKLVLIAAVSVAKISAANTIAQQPCGKEKTAANSKNITETKTDSLRFILIFLRITKDIYS